MLRRLVLALIALRESTAPPVVLRAVLIAKVDNTVVRLEPHQLLFVSLVTLGSTVAVQQQLVSTAQLEHTASHLVLLIASIAVMANTAALPVPARMYASIVELAGTAKSQLMNALSVVWANSAIP